MSDTPRDTISSALARAQTAMSHPKKTKTNPHYKSDYADLADVLNAVRPALNAEGIAVVQTIDNGDLVTELRWNDEVISSRIPLNIDVKPQELGSQLSYLRRYALSAIAGVASESDDDGNAAQSAPARPQQRYTKVDTGYDSTSDDPAAVHYKDSDPYKAAAANPPEKPLAAMTAGEMARYADVIRVKVSGTKADILRTLEPYVLAATAEEPWDLPAGSDTVGAITLPPWAAGTIRGAPPEPQPDIPFNPVVHTSGTERRQRDAITDDIRRGE